MRSKTYCFNGPLYKRTVLRLWPIWTAATVFFFFLIPASMWQSLANGWSYLLDAGPSYYARDFIYDMLRDGFPIFIMILSGGTALFIWNWMFTARSANCHFSLPLKREGLFLTNYLAGLTVSIIPIVITIVLTMLVEICFGGLELKSLMTMLFVSVSCTILFFSLATLCAVATGNIVAMPVFFLILNFLAYGIYALVKWLAATFVFGLYDNYAAPQFIWWLTPIINMIENCGMIRGEVWIRDSFYGFSNGIANLWYYAVYAAAGLGLGGVALLAFRKRPAEAAGDLIAFNWLKPVFQIGLALCFAMLMTTFVQEAYFYSDPIFTVTLILMVLWGFIGYFGAEMLLRKSFRVFQAKTFRTWGIVTVCALLVLVGAKLDIFGYERYIPAEHKVETVSIDGIVNSVEADYATAAAIHKAIIDGSREGEDAVVRLRYELKNGKVVTRRYHVDFDSPEFELVREWATREEILIKSAFNRLESTDQFRWVNVHDEYNGVYVEIDGHDTNASIIYQAILRDFAEGNCGFDYMYGNRTFERAYYVEFSYYALPYDPVVYGSRTEYEDTVGTTWSYVYVTENMHHTIRAIESIDLTQYMDADEYEKYYNAVIVDGGY